MSDFSPWNGCCCRMLAMIFVWDVDLSFAKMSFGSGEFWSLLYQSRSSIVERRSSTDFYISALTCDRLASRFVSEVAAPGFGVLLY